MKYDNPGTGLINFFFRNKYFNPNWLKTYQVALKSTMTSFGPAPDISAWN